MIYLNNASTTKVSNEVMIDFMDCANKYWANPSDISNKGFEAKQIIYNAQKQVASYINADPDEIVFTSGGSESNNWAIKGYIDNHPHCKNIITTEIEHPSVYNTCLFLKSKGINVTYIPVTTTGVVDAEILEKVILNNWIFKPFVTIMLANNEIGSINDIKSISKIVKRYGGILHVDAVQAFGQIPINVKEMGIDLLSVSFHKFNGFKNSGFLYINKNIELTPLIHGGHQFDGRRAGTENIPMIYALGRQVERLQNKPFPSTENRDYLLNQIYTKLGSKLGSENISLNGCPTNRLPNNLSITIGFNSEKLITLLDGKGINISNGSACSSGEKVPSRILKAIGLTDNEAFSTIRITLNEDITKKECDVFVKELDDCISLLMF